MEHNGKTQRDWKPARERRAIAPDHSAALKAAQAARTAATITYAEALDTWADAITEIHGHGYTITAIAAEAGVGPQMVHRAVTRA